ncbi:hypothetical protein MHB71_01810 [Paenibacillus sp. FSL H7-0940]|uniref:hypothetical protein n=1 Tax=Paenibacillus sp. FSL H7-0940 TaxID=2921443 RepID=UPI0030ED9445
MFKTYDLFDHRSIDDVLPEIFYLYLFQGLSLTQIEVKLFKTENYKGWLSKTLLNFYHIDTEGNNKGIYEKKTIPEVVDILYKSTDLSHIAVAKYLRKKYM